jgi:hypothetical protein
MTDYTLITVESVMKQCQPGDLVLTANPSGRLGKLIRFGERIEQGDESVYGHAAIMAKHMGIAYEVDGYLFESVKTISRNPITNYKGQKICIFRHKQMTDKKFFLGREEILDNIGQVYPFHRLAFHGVGMLYSWFLRTVFRKKKPWLKPGKLGVLDWPVCSELAAQFLCAAGLETGFAVKGWRGVNPDHLDDARQTRTDLYETVIEGIFKK